MSKIHNKTHFLILGLLLTILLLVAVTPARAGIDRFNDPSFANTWARTDNPVESQANIGEHSKAGARTNV